MRSARQQGAREARRSSRPPDNRTDSQEHTRGRWPELRIIRKANYEAPEAEEWNLFLSDIGSRNYGKGYAKCLGSMACVFVDAQSMGRMLAKKYSKPFEDRKRTEQVQRSLARNFNAWVRQQEKSRIDAQFDQKTASRTNCRSLGLIAIGDELRLEHDERAETFEQEQFDDEVTILLDDELLLDDGIVVSGATGEPRWNQGVFPVRGIEPYGHSDLGMDLSTNEQLYREYEDVRSYLKHEGLDINLLTESPRGKRLFEPHASFFETFGPAGQADLQYKYGVPQALPLGSPHAYVNK